MLSEPGEQLDEAKLAKGCRLKPEDNLVVVRMAGKRGVAFFELRCGLARPEARAQPAQLAKGQATGNRSRIEGVAPRQYVPVLAKTRLPERTPCRFAVDNVEYLQRHPPSIRQHLCLALA